MPPVLVIAAKDLRQRFRDRSAIVLGFVAPLAIAALMSFAFKGTESFHITVGIVDRDHGAVATAFSNFMRSPDLENVVTVRTFGDEASASARVHSGALAAAVVIPPGFSTAATTGSGAAQLDVLTSTNSRLGAEVTRSLAGSFVNQVNADRLSVETAIAAGAPASRIAQLAAAASKLRVPETVTNLPIGSKPLKAVSYYAPSMAIFFLLFAIGFTSRSFFSEVNDGMIDRIAAAPVRPTSLLFGKALSVFAYGIASLTTVLVFTSIFFGASWGNPLSVAALSLAMVVAVVALTALVIALARTDRQAEGLSSIVVFSLALIGGNFVSISAAPPVMRRLALFTPNGWAMRGFVDLTTGARGAGVVVQPVLGMLAFSVIVGAGAVLLSRRLVIR
jgi:ABC-2 type transport system permease protein